MATNARMNFLSVVMAVIKAELDGRHATLEFIEKETLLSVDRIVSIVYDNLPLYISQGFEVEVRLNCGPL